MTAGPPTTTQAGPGTTPGKGRTKKLSDALIDAWTALYPDDVTKRRGDAGARAALRRAPSPAAVLLEPAFHALLMRMAHGGFDCSGIDGDRAKLERLALVTGVLAQRRDCDNVSSPRFMQALGGVINEGERRPLSALRFQALMAAMDRDDGEAKMTALRRALSMIDRADFNVSAFIDDVMRWNEPVRIRWTFDYFGRPRAAAPSASDDDPSSAETDTVEPV